MPKFGTEVLAMYVYVLWLVGVEWGGVGGCPLGFRCWPGFWCGRKLLSGCQGVGLVSGVQDTGLASGEVRGQFSGCWPGLSCGGRLLPEIWDWIG